MKIKDSGYTNSAVAYDVQLEILRGVCRGSPRFWSQEVIFVAFLTGPVVSVLLSAVYIVAGLMAVQMWL